ncbi:HAAS signaling domain-containing protein [Terrilactibacillus laevilacticus]|uniref:HAAS domain-containing protein n=1 Tax=Terrilactibacillus laevilacticus TaxID=1380157 RepID=A0ABW5PUW0_9BACI|nr:DUF1700 domain-containing protein [Terrilactibacillus laevilacticus]
MKKNDFMTQLSLNLRHIPEVERQDILDDMNEHFAIGLENGKTEEEIIDELGTPIEIAKEFLEDTRFIKEEKKRSASWGTRSILSAIGLLFINLIFVVGPLCAIIGVYFGLCATAFGFILSPLAIILTFFQGDISQFVLTLFSSMALFGIGILFGIGLIKIGKWGYFILMKYFKFNIRVIRGDK